MGKHNASRKVKWETLNGRERARFPPIAFLDGGACHEGAGKV